MMAPAGSASPAPGNVACFAFFVSVINDLLELTSRQDAFPYNPGLRHRGRKSRREFGPEMKRKRPNIHANKPSDARVRLNAGWCNASYHQPNYPEHELINGRVTDFAQRHVYRPGAVVDGARDRHRGSQERRLRHSRPRSGSRARERNERQNEIDAGHSATTASRAGSTRAAQYLNSGILPKGSSCGFVRMLAAASA